MTRQQNVTLVPSIPVIGAFIPIVVASLILRFFILLRSTQNQRRKHSCLDLTSMGNQTFCTNPQRNDQNKTRPIKTVVVLGSGGHTTEMIHLLEQLDTDIYSPIVYIVANSDNTSIARLKQYIEEKQSNNQLKAAAVTAKTSRWEGRYPLENESSCQNNPVLGTTSTLPHMAPVRRLPRPREVHQSYISSIVPTLRSVYYTLHLLQRENPDLLLTNGPGMCVPLIYLIFLSRLLMLSTTCRMIFVESLCRVQTLSLSGKLVYPIVDQFVVHWPSLKQKYSLVNICDVFVCQEKDN